MTQNAADSLKSIAKYLKLDGQEGRARAYSRAAQSVREAPTVPADPSQLDGIGESIREDVFAALYEDEVPLLEELKKRYPIFEVTKEIDGVGPKTTRKLANAGISSETELREAVQSGDILEVDGIGPKTAEEIERNL